MNDEAGKESYMARHHFVKILSVSIVNTILAFAGGYLYAYLTDHYGFAPGGEIIYSLVVAIGAGAVTSKSTKVKIIASVSFAVLDIWLVYFGLIMFIGEAF